MAQKLNNLINTCFVVLVIFSLTSALEPTHIPNLLEKPLEIPVAPNAFTQIPANYLTNLHSLLHGSPDRLVLPIGINLEAESDVRKTLYKLAPYAVMNTPKATVQDKPLKLGAEEPSNTTIHGWFWVFLLILAVLAWVTHQTIKEEAKREARQNAENRRQEERRDYEAEYSRGVSENDTTMRFNQSERVNMNHSEVSNDVVVEHSGGR